MLRRFRTSFSRMPELISDDPLDDKDEADEEGDAEVKGCDAFI